jgi:iron-only hydrogenase group A
MNFTIDVNNAPLQTQDGETLLDVLRRNGFKIPTLCHMPGFTPSGACRLCVVEVEGKRDLITSCSYPVEKGMVVKTNSPRVIKARKAIVEMLLANHPDDCLYCERNGNCELQWLAEELHVKERKFFSRKNTDQRDHSSPSVYRDPAKCILCNRCVRVCEEVQVVTAIEFIARGNKTKVNSAFNKGLNVSSCINCGQCIMVCPTGALVDISHIEKVQSAINNPSSYAMAMISPGFVASVAEYFPLKNSDNPAGLITAALKKMGFQKVYDMSMANDFNVILEAEILLNRVENKINKPLISSNCSAWVEYVEEFTPQILGQLSTVKSPQHIMGRLIKYKLNPGFDIYNIFNVSFVPCVANKSEAARDVNTQKGISETDAVITVREFLRMLRSFGLNLNKLEASNPEDPFRNNSTAGYQMSYAGGKAEAIAIQIHAMVNGKDATGFKFTIPKNPGSRKEVKLKFGPHDIGFAWVSGILEAQKYLDHLKEEGRNDIHYIEVMACPGGCAGGGGQPIVIHSDRQKSRKKVSQDLEKTRKNLIAELNLDLDRYRSNTTVEGVSEFYTRFHERLNLK